MVLGLLSVVFIVGGLVLAVVALAGISKHGKAGLLGRGIGGLLLNGLMVAMFIGALAGGFRKAGSNRASINELDEATRDLRSSTSGSFDPELGITNDIAKELGSFKAKVDSAAKNASGDNAKIMQAVSGFTAKLWAATQKFSDAGKAFQDADVINFATLKEKSQIAGRQGAIQEFQKANKEFKRITTRQGTLVRAELLAQNLSGSNVENFMTGFDKSQSKMTPKISGIRECDDRLAVVMSKILTLAEQQWGGWHYDPAQEATMFDDEQAAKTFEELIGKITEESGKQLQLQKDLIKLQEILSPRGK